MASPVAAFWYLVGWMLLSFAHPRYRRTWRRDCTDYSVIGLAPTFMDRRHDRPGALMGAALWRRAVAECLGAGPLVSVVVGSGIMATRLSAEVGIQLLANSTTTALGRGRYGVRMRQAARLGLIMVLLLGGAACTGDGRQPEMGGTLTIFASTSLTEVFTSMANGFSTAYPAVRVDVTLGPDSDLARRAAAGPPPDLIALEGHAPMTAAGPTGTPVRFARNQLVLAVPANNPKGLRGLADLNRPDVRLALCAESEPCGTVAATALAEAQVAVPATAVREPDVRAALAQLRDGHVDVALVYRSDARLAGDAIATLEFAQSQAAQAEFLAAIPTAAKNAAAANAFLAYLTSAPTLDGLTNAGFRPPD